MFFQTHLDITLWAGQLSDRERLCISEDDDCYLQEESPTQMLDADDDSEQEE